MWVVNEKKNFPLSHCGKSDEKLAETSEWTAKTGDFLASAPFVIFGNELPFKCRDNVRESFGVFEHVKRGR